MSKAAAVVGIGATGTVLAVGGSYMMGAFGSPLNIDVPTSLSELKGSGDKLIVGNYFPGLTLNSSNEGEAWGTDKKPEKTFLKTNNSSVGTSHLVINWEKFACSASSGEKTWTGRIRWLWTFSHNNKGFLVYLNAIPSTTEDSKLSVEGIIYVLSKETTKGTWEAKYHKKTNENLTVGNSDNKLPVPSDYFKNTLKVKDHWGFIDATDTLEKLCKMDNSQTDESKTKPTKEFKGAWVWQHKTGKSNQLMDWSKKDNNDYQWLNTFFGTLTPKFEDLVKDFPGTWEEGRLMKGELALSEAASGVGK